MRGDCDSVRCNSEQQLDCGYILKEELVFPDGVYMDKNGWKVSCLRSWMGEIFC